MMALIAQMGRTLGSGLLGAIEGGGLATFCNYLYQEQPLLDTALTDRNTIYATLIGGSCFSLYQLTKEIRISIKYQKRKHARENQERRDILSGLE